MILPNFFIVGANKAGTTSLCNYLQQHPQIYMSKVKEPMFFMVEDIDSGIRRGPNSKHLIELVDNIKDYCALFDGVGEEKAIGEASTGYLPNPNAPKRIQQLAPDAKFIAILRDPVERAYSAYTFHVQEGIEQLTDFSLAIKEEKKPDNWRHYIRLGFYYKQVKLYMDIFGHSRVKVYLYEDLRADPASVLKNIFRFLEVNESFTPNMSIKHNVTRIPKNKLLHAFLTNLNAITYFPKHGKKNKGLFDSLIKLNLVKPPKLRKEVRKDLIEVYREDILKLQDLIQRDLSMWLE